MDDPTESSSRSNWPVSHCGARQRRHIASLTHASEHRWSFIQSVASMRCLERPLEGLCQGHASRFRLAWPENLPTPPHQHTMLKRQQHNGGRACEARMVLNRLADINPDQKANRSVEALQTHRSEPLRDRLRDSSVHNDQWPQAGSQ